MTKLSRSTQKLQISTSNEKKCVSAGENYQAFSNLEQKVLLQHDTHRYITAMWYYKN